MIGMERKQYVYAVIGVVIAFVGIVVVVLMSTIGRSGSIILTVPKENTTIFVDLEEQYITKKNNETVTLSVRSGTRSVLAHNPDSLPWGKTLYIPSRGTARADIVLVPATVSWQNVPASKPTDTKLLTYQQAAALFISHNINTFSEDAKMRVDIEGQSLVEQWLGEEKDLPTFCGMNDCKTPTTIFTTEKQGAAYKIKDVVFFPGRDDAVIFSIADGVYAIELDRRPVQNFFPVYRGLNPYVTIKDGYVYVKDGEKIVYTKLP
jgi:hypothetical protein